MRFSQQSLWLCALALGLFFTASSTQAGVVFFQGFEGGSTAGWNDGGGFGSVSPVMTGPPGTVSSSGAWHANFSQTGSGPYTQFDGYRSTFPSGGFTASVDIYLDTSWAAGEGFDYSVAASGSDGNHQRDFIFHVTKDSSTGDLLVGASNNTNFDPIENLESGNHSVISSSGWYTFEHAFRDDNGVLAVDLNLYDSMGNLIFTETRSDPSDLIPSEVGGNRYGWFTNIDILNGIEVDNVQLTVGLQAIPEPATMALWGGAILFGAAFTRRRKKKLVLANQGQ